MTALVYQDFDLSIEPSSSDPLRYRARVSSLAAGEASAEFTLPFSVQDLKILFLELGRPRRGVRAIGSSEMKAAQIFGSQLFTTVFSGQVQSALFSSLNQARQQGQGLRIRLRLRNAPVLADLPWEFLYDPDHNHFLAYSTVTPLVRYLDLPHTVAPLAIQPPLKVLVMIANPRDHGYATLNVEDEWRKVQGALADLQSRGLVQVTRLEAATLSALQRQLRHNQYHIFHFVGHGGFDNQSQSGALLLEDEQGRSRMVSGHYLGALLRDHFSLRLALLNACEGARTSPSDPFAGVAQHLVQQGIPAVIAMQFEITDQAAITLSHEFYNALADNYGVDAALSQARMALFLAGNDIEWGTPVLYLRAQYGELFDLAALPLPPISRAEPPPPTQSDAAISNPAPQAPAAAEVKPPQLSSVEQSRVQKDARPQPAIQSETASPDLEQQETIAQAEMQPPKVEQLNIQPDTEPQSASQLKTASTSVPQVPAATQQVQSAARQRKRTQPTKHSLLKGRVATPAKLPLLAWNPFHYLTLLWWIFITPQQLQAYRTKDGKLESARLDPMGGYLTTSLTWLPLLLPTVALWLGWLPRSADAWPATAYGWISLCLIAAVALSGWLDKYDTNSTFSVAVGVAVGVAVVVTGVVAGDVAGVVVVGVAIVVAVVMAVGVTGVGAGGVAFGVAFGVAVVVAVGVAVVVVVGVTFGVAVCVTFGVTFGVAVGVLKDNETPFWWGIGTATLVAGSVTGYLVGSVWVGVAVVVAGSVAGGVVVSLALGLGDGLYDSVNRGTASWLSYSCFSALVLAYGFLIWYCYFGGYRWFA